MLLETDRQGRQQSYLSSEELFQQLKKFEGENRLIPIVGDFAGPRAFKTRRCLPQREWTARFDFLHFERRVLFVQ